PVLLVAAGREALVEGADLLERGPADRHVGAPDELGGAVLRAQVEVRDRRLFAATGARCGPLEAGADRPSECACPWVSIGTLRQRAQPAGRRPHVVVDHRDQAGCGGPHAGVARGVGPLWLLTAYAADLRGLDHGRRAVARAVVDHDDLVLAVD